MGKKKKTKKKKRQKKINNKKQELIQNNEIDMEKFVKEHNAKAMGNYLAGNGPVFFINSYQEIKESDNNNPQASFYRTFCNEGEINRILAVNSAEAYLLKTRADAVVDNPRIHRVILQRKKKSKEMWNFTNHFSKDEFNYCLDLLSKDDRLELSNVPMGFTFTKEPNGACMSSDFGNIIVVSEALKYFFFYMNLCFIRFDAGEVPTDVGIEALTIALRTMLLTESLDFDLDPRGEIPKEIELENNETVKKQIQFVISHEFAHHLLGHLDKRSIVERNVLSSTNSENAQGVYKFYTNTQKQEFEADIEAIARLQFHNQWELEEMVQNAIMFFIYIDVYERVRNQIFPPFGNSSTHPDPIDRIWNLYDAYSHRVNFNKSTVEKALNFADTIKQYLEEDVAVNIEKYETYGSLYLEQWRGKVLVDRIDY